MGTIGIIAEYNPFHNGHKFQMDKAKIATNSENVIIAMSGNYVQRGEPAIINKWERAKTALLNGADVVIEIPTMFSSSTAETFSNCGVKLLDDCGIIDFLCFGSESGNIESLKTLSENISNETEEFKEIIKKYVNKGLSYPSARQKALEETSPENFKQIETSNNILATEYLKALKKLDSKITPITIQRIGESYNSTNINSSFASATAIRNKVNSEINNNNFDLLENSMPQSSYNILISGIKNGVSPIFFDNFSHYLNYCLRFREADYLKEILDISEGLENRIINSLEKNYLVSEILKDIKTKRYTLTRLQRALLHIILDIKTEEFLTAKENGYSPYIRVLGFKKEKSFLVSEMVKNSKIPVFTSFKKGMDLENENIRNFLKKENIMTNIYFSASPTQKNKQLNKEYTTPVIIV